MSFPCPRCRASFEKGRSKSAHMRHCGRVLKLRTLPGWVALRHELRRVARIEGRPDGFAPSLRGFRALGRLTDKRVQGAVGGYRNCNPVLGWQETMRRLGLRPASELRFAGNRRRVMEDVYRVARFVGQLRHGIIREVVACALAIHRGEEMPPVAEPSLSPVVEDEEGEEPALSRDELRGIIREELLKNPDALAPEIRAVVESRGRLPFQPTSFPPIVSFMRRELGISSPTRTEGRVRRIA